MQLCRILLDAWNTKLLDTVGQLNPGGHMAFGLLQWSPLPVYFLQPTQDEMDVTDRIFPIVDCIDGNLDESIAVDAGRSAPVLYASILLKDSTSPSTISIRPLFRFLMKGFTRLAIRASWLCSSPFGIEERGRAFIGFSLAGRITKTLASLTSRLHRSKIAGCTPHHASRRQSSSIHQVEHLSG